MEERPIIVPREHVRSIIKGNSTRFYRVVKPQPKSPAVPLDECPYGVAGDMLWVKEEFYGDRDKPISYPKRYRADFPDDYDEAMTFDHSFGFKKWQKPLLMPRDYARLVLEITGVNCMRIQNMLLEPTAVWLGDTPAAVRLANSSAVYYHFIDPWNAQNPRKYFQWAANLYTWVIRFKVAELTVIRRP